MSNEYGKAIQEAEKARSYLAAANKMKAEGDTEKALDFYEKAGVLYERSLILHERRALSRMPELSDKVVKDLSALQAALD